MAHREDPASTEPAFVRALGSAGFMRRCTEARGVIARPRSREDVPISLADETDLPAGAPFIAFRDAVSAAGLPP